MSVKECRDYKKCPLCGGIMFKDYEHCECIACGFYLSKDCCKGEESAIGKK